MDTKEAQINNQLITTPSNTLITSTMTETINNDSLRNLSYNNLINNQNKNEEKKSTGNNGRWEHSEHIRFLGGCLQFGNNWKKVETYVKTRTSTQIRSHAQKYLNKLQKKYFNNNSFSFSNLNNSKHLENRTDNFNDNSNEENNNINSNNINENFGGIIEYNNSEGKIIDIQENDIKMNQKYKINEEKLKQLLNDLPKPNFDIEIVEKIILKIFCFHKKYDNSFFNGDNNYNKSPTFKKFYRKYDIKANDIQKKSNKNIFFCQKLKREPNYEKQIKEMLDSNDPKDLEKLFYIYQTGNEGKDDPSYKILMNHLENYD